jgi:hypothetical protein
VIIPSSVASIGDYAFCDCTALTSVTLPSSVTSIGDWAFYDCEKLTTVIVPCTNPLGIEPGSDGYGYVAKYAEELTLIHEYSAAYVWADDGSSCTVTISCVHGDTDLHTENPEVSSSVKIPPTETEMGTTEYSVSGTYEGLDYSSVKDIQDIPATGGGSGDDDILLYAAVAAIAVIGALAVCYLLFLRNRKTE